MALIVLKFGGTSLGNPTRIKRAARRIRARLRTGNRVIAVVSANGNSTDRILQWLGAVDAHASREFDRALATGEDLSAAYFAAALNTIGIRARSLRGPEAGLLAKGEYGAATLCDLHPAPLSELLDNNVVPVVTGFQALRIDGETVTLGRGGSDATAVFIAGKLRADACHIVTDVEAVCDVDPNESPDATPLPSLSHAALVQITEAGGEVVQPAAARFAQTFQTRLFVYHYKAPFHGFDGTEIGNVLTARRAS